MIHIALLETYLSRAFCLPVIFFHQQRPFVGGTGLDTASYDLGYRSSNRLSCMNPARTHAFHEDALFFPSQAPPARVSMPRDAPPQRLNRPATLPVRALSTPE